MGILQGQVEELKAKLVEVEQLLGPAVKRTVEVFSYQYPVIDSMVGLTNGQQTGMIVSSPCESRLSGLTGAPVKAVYTSSCACVCKEIVFKNNN